MYKIYTVDPWTIQIWTAQVHIYGDFCNRYRVIPPYPWVSHLCVQPTADGKYIFMICSWKSSDGKGQLYALFCTISCNRLKHPWILVSAWVLESVPHTYWEMTAVMFLENRNLYTDFWLRTPMLFKVNCTWKIKHYWKI